LRVKSSKVSKDSAVPASGIVGTSPAETSFRSGICGSKEPIPVAELGHQVNLKTCDIRGHLIELSLGIWLMRLGDSTK
jgi:hypothetical protein